MMLGVLLTVLFVLPQSAQSETELRQKLETLKIRETELALELDKVRKSLKEAQFELDQMLVKETPSTVVIQSKARRLVLSEFRPGQQMALGDLEVSEKVEIQGYTPECGGWYRVKFRGDNGFIRASELDLDSNFEARLHPLRVRGEAEYRQRLKEEEERAQREKVEGERRQQERAKAEKLEQQKRIVAERKADERKREDLLLRYGQEITWKILNRQYWIGMTSEMAVESLGRPEEINRTVFPNNVHEQWVYPRGLYLYFENGILTSFQNRK